MSVKTPYLIADLLKDWGFINTVVHKQAVSLYIKNAASKATLTSSGLAGALGGLTSGGAKGLLTSSTKLLSITLDTAFTVIGAIWTVGTFLSARKKRKAAQRKRERFDFRSKQVDDNSADITKVIDYSRATGKVHSSDIGQALESNLDYDKASSIIKDYGRADIRIPIVDFIRSKQAEKLKPEVSNSNLSSKQQKEKENEEEPQRS